MASPELMHATASDDAEAAQSEGRVALSVDLVSLDTEQVVLRAAQANAAIQLGECSILLSPWTVHCMSSCTEYLLHVIMRCHALTARSLVPHLWQHCFFV